MKKRTFQASDLPELREEVYKLREEGLKIISHFQKMQEYYSDWEDRLLTIEKKIQQAEEDLGLTTEKVMVNDPLADAFGTS